ncbi:MAG: hypothetical protein QNJ17_02810 [Desulfocapsaceae bacterium]|nr:hypothetical protein [Desulfocapsaceae bacterium]
MDVWRLPYGRTSDRANWRLVIPENRGNCSTKHALLKQLADELGLDIHLVLGIYDMNEGNTSGVGEVMEKYDLEAIPEAHCYLKYEGRRFDFTRCDDKMMPQPNLQYISEITISPEDIGERKIELHQSYIREKVTARPFAEIWKIREECIAALAE